MITALLALGCGHDDRSGDSGAGPGCVADGAWVFQVTPDPGSDPSCGGPVTYTGASSLGGALTVECASECTCSQSLTGCLLTVDRICYGSDMTGTVHCEFSLSQDSFDGPCTVTDEFASCEETVTGTRM
jgi:hypothetical protein